jgi:hypothetical protein
MGCTGSKNNNAVVSNAPPEFKEMKNTKPDALRKEINELYKYLLGQREILKPLLLEKYGLTCLLEEERANLESLLAKKEELIIKRKPLMDITFEHDAEEINKAFQKSNPDKGALVRILCARPKWQITLIAETYYKRYNTNLLEKCVNELTTFFGKLSGAGTALSKLLIYRIMDQPERDAAFLRDFTDGISLEDENLLEIICTRTNEELKNAIDIYSKVYKKNIVDIIKSKASYKNYREFVIKILEYQKDETYLPLDYALAKEYADELYAAGAARSIGIDPEPFIRILSRLNNRQFEVFFFFFF